MSSLPDAKAARSANDDLFESMGAYAIEIVNTRGGHELVVHFSSDPLPRVPATVRAPRRGDVRVSARRSAAV